MEDTSSDSDMSEMETAMDFHPQKEIYFNRLLPYADKLDDESIRLFADIKGNLGRAMMLREYRPGFGVWVSRLNKFLKVYGLKFSKEDHVALIKLLYDALTIEDLETNLIYKISNSLSLLLKKSYLLSTTDLTLDWRPLYELRQRTINRKDLNLGMFRYFASLEQNLGMLIEDCKVYFPKNATQEILDQWRPFLCPFSTKDMCDAVDSLLLFLPLKVKQDDLPHTILLWLPEMIDLWNTCHNIPQWENSLMRLLAKAAEYSVGCFDWEPYIPLMFTRFLRSFELPVSYNGFQNGKTRKLGIGSIALWIVSTLGPKSSTIIHLRQMMNSVDSYFHHANQGRWVSKLRSLLKKLSGYFVDRLHRERYAKMSWLGKTRDEHKLTEENITEFVDVLLPSLNYSIYGGNNEILTTVKHLSLLRPNLVIPLILEKIYTNVDSLTEPHKLTAALVSAVSTARPLAEGVSKGFPEGPTHIIPLLNAMLPGIDPNDIRKSFVTFQFISTFVSLIPLIDSSNASEFYSDLTEEEEIICEATAGLEDFVLQFMDRVFTVIESSSKELTRLEHTDGEKKSPLESLAENALSSLCGSLLMQTSPAIFKSALHKMDSFLNGKVMEVKVSGALVAVMVRSFAKVNPEEVCKMFIPRLCESILSGLKEVNKKEENLDNEILFNLLILSEVVHPSGRALLPYEDLLMAVLDQTLWLACRHAAYSANHLLGRILSSLSNIAAVEYRSSPIPYDTHIKEFLPIRIWGAPGDLSNLNIQFYVPDKIEVECIKRFVWRYLPLELRRLDLHAASSNTTAVTTSNESEPASAPQENGKLEREELHRSLGVVLALLNCKTVLPPWEEPPISLLETNVDIAPMILEIGCPGEISMPDGSNIRRTVAETMARLQDKILSATEGDTKSLLHLIAIWNTLLLNKTNGDRGFETHWRNYHNVKMAVEDKLRKGKKHLRGLLIDRVMLQHQLRLEASIQELTATHVKIFKRLLDLSTSAYSEIRSQAQAKLLNAIGHFTYSYTLLIPEIKKILQKDSNVNHESFKGALYLLSGPKTVPLIARPDWNMVNQIWPTLVDSNLSEKPSVIGLLSSLIKTVHTYFPTITINLDIPDHCIERARTMWNNYPVPKQNIPSPEEIEQGIINLKKTGEQNLLLYNDTICKLMNSIESGKLHWRYNYMAFNFLRDLVHPNVKYEPRVIKCFLNSLNHDSLDLRKLVIRTTTFVLKQQKRAHKKIDFQPIYCGCSPKPGDRPDNKWLQYTYETRPFSAEEWDKPRYLHKAYHGYYTWPAKVQMYAPSSEQPNLDRDISELSPAEMEVHAFFMNEDNVATLIEYLSMEEKKGKDKFSAFRFVLFKNLFRNHGDTFLPIFLPHIERLVVDKQEQNQRCGAELIAAIIRGSKHWPYEKIEKLWTVLTPILETALANMIVETVSDWGTCFATASEGRDPNRNHWLYEILLKEPLREESSYLECGRLYVLQGALNQQEWRVAELLHRAWDYFKNYLMHPFQNVRERLSSVLTNITETDILFPKGNRTISPRIEMIMSEVTPQLKTLYKSGLKDFNHVSKNVGNGDSSSSAMNKGEEAAVLIEKINLTDDEKDKTIRLLKTIFKWIVSVISRMHYFTLKPFYELFGLACILQSYEHDEEVSKTCTQVLAMLSQALHSHEEIPIALKEITEIAQSSPSWSARVAVTKFLQSLVFHNMSLIIANQNTVTEVQNIVLILIKDEKLEVRTSAASVLSGFLHCNLILNPENLLREFMVKAKTKLKRRASRQKPSETSNKQSSSSVTILEENEAIRQRHSAILGLCAFIDAHPYDVPSYIPDIFLELGKYLNDPQPIPTTIRKSLGDFKRTHHDSWELHKLQFTEEQLAVLSDLSVPPSYYA